jgi:uroporphyrinogen decarboxylase
VQIFDSWAGILSESEFDLWSIAPTAEIVRRVKASHPAVPIIGFPRGCGQRAVEYAIATGVDAVSIDYATPARWARDALPCTVQGNLDPVVLLAGGTTMEREVHRLREIFAGKPYVFNLGHGVLPETPPQHVADLVALVRGAR